MPAASGGIFWPAKDVETWTDRLQTVLGSKTFEFHICTLVEVLNLPSECSPFLHMVSVFLQNGCF